MAIDLINDLILMIIAYVYVLITIFVPVQLKKRDLVSKFVARKIVHLFAGLVVLIVPFFTWPFFAVIIAGTLTTITYFSSNDSPVKSLKELYETIGEEEEENVGLVRRRSFLQGPFHYCLSITSLITIFALFAPHQFYFPIAGILIMIIADTLASLVGKNYGKLKLKLPWTGTRTVEGSATFFASAFVLCFFAFLFFGLINPMDQIALTFETVLLYSFITAALGTIIELMSPSTLDDLTVPIGTTIVIYALVILI